MRVLQIIASVDPRHGGVSTGVLQQAEFLTAEGWVVHIASLDAPDAPWVTQCSATVVALGEPEGRAKSFLSRRLSRYGYSPKAVSWLRRSIGDYDVVIVNGLWNYSTLAARRTLVGSRVPYFVFTHGMLDPWFKKYALKSMLKQLFWSVNEGPLLNHSNAVLFTTEDEREVSRNAFWPYRVRERVVGYGCADIAGVPSDQIASFRSTLPKLGDRKYLLFLSRIHEKKGCDLLIDAFASVAQDNPDLDLVIAGPDQTGWQSDLQQKAHAHGIADRIHWPGMVGGDAKWGAFHGCEAFVLPSHQENFGIVVAEALAAGKAVLISNKVQIWREVDDAGAGMVEPDSLAGTTRLLERFLSLGEREKQDIGASARRLFIERFEISRVMRSFKSTLVDVQAI